jgi:hypothetical protein
MARFPRIESSHALFHSGLDQQVKQVIFAH